MRYTLRGEIVVSPGHDSDKAYKFRDSFDSDSENEAIVIARATVQSQNIKRANDGVVRLDARLSDSRDDTIWTTKLVQAVHKEERVLVTPEHFEETIHPS